MKMELNLTGAPIPLGVLVFSIWPFLRAWFLDRYNIVSDTDLKMAAKKHHEYFESQMGTVLGTIDGS